MHPRHLLLNIMPPYSPTLILSHHFRLDQSLLLTITAHPLGIQNPFFFLQFLLINHHPLTLLRIRISTEPRSIRKLLRSFRHAFVLLGERVLRRLTAAPPLALVCGRCCGNVNAGSFAATLLISAVFAELNALTRANDIA